MAKISDTNAYLLSPSSLNLFLECPKCFYSEQKLGIHRPSGPFSSLPSGMDLLIKKHFDDYRVKNEMPPELVAKVDGRLFPDMEILKKWRSWRSGLRFQNPEDGSILVGALDDCLITDDYSYIPIDYKTRGFELKEDSQNFYQNQLNCYSFLLEKNNLKQLNYAYLAYFIPRLIVKNKHQHDSQDSEFSPKMLPDNALIEFSVQIKKMATKPENAFDVFRKAIGLLNGSEPGSHSDCDFCAWAVRVAD